ncbi:MAG: TIGR04283 family arsenosugar biosynthesis glycosyltransferase [Elusimicrobia bacterium]|nr:TIGR04283 family arsenosugar biosynthesis glycosyltransferase [Elusimicrobiota bacterium]
MKVSLIIPVLNEGERLRGVLSRLREAKRETPTEVIVVDGKSSDNSLSVAKDLADKVLVAQRSCRAVQLHHGALVATGDVLLFLHADTVLPDRWQEVLVDAWRRTPAPAATAFRLSFDRKETAYRVVEWATGLRLRFTGVPHGDQAIAVARDVYFTVGGFPDVPLMEEYFLIHKLRCYGRVQILPERVATSARRYEKNGPLWNAFRNSLLVTLFYLKVPVHVLARMYR